MSKEIICPLCKDDSVCHMTDTALGSVWMCNNDDCPTEEFHHLDEPLDYLEGIS